jgi:hypothetical protein
VSWPRTYAGADAPSEMCDLFDRLMRLLSAATEIRGNSATPMPASAALHYVSVGELDAPADAVGGVEKEGLAGAGDDFSSYGPPLEFVQLC